MSLSPLKSSVAGSAKGVGIEIGTKTFSALELSRQDGYLHITDVVNCSVPEFAEDVPDELLALAGSKKHLCFSLPPSGINDMVEEIPAAFRESSIEQHVQSQASSLCSMADEPFIYDYQVMSGLDAKHKMLVTSMTKESAFADSFELLRSLVFRTHGVTSCAFAMVSAFVALHPEEAYSDRAQLLLCLKEEISILCIIKHGCVQYSSCLMFGAKNLVVSLNRDEDSGRNLLKSEYDSAMVRWQENLHLSEDNMVCDYWLLGNDSSRLKYFHSMFGSIVPSSQVNIMGIPGSMLPQKDEQLHSDLVIPFGLALQSLGESIMTISLLPERMKWLERKEQEYKYLLTGFILFGVSLFVLITGMMFYLSRSIAVISEEEYSLSQCSTLFPEMTKLHSKIRFQQKRMLPVVESVYRTHCYLDVLKNWQQAQSSADAKEKSWGIYMADEYSFERVHSVLKTASHDTQGSSRTAVAKNGLFDVENKATVQAEHAIKIEDRKILHKIYVGGIVPLGKTRYKILKNIQTKLMDTGAYINVDDHSDMLSNDFLTKYYDPWMNFLRGNRKALDCEYSAFFLELPLSGNFIDNEQLQKQ